MIAATAWEGHLARHMNHKRFERLVTRATVIMAVALIGIAVLLAARL